MTITVVAAVIERDGAFLLTLRPAGTHLEGHWEFPGGKCHPQETHAEALRRELYEELDIVGDGRRARAFDHARLSRRRPSNCTSIAAAFEGEPKPMMGQEMRWVARDGAARAAVSRSRRQLIRMLSSPAGLSRARRAARRPV